MVAFGDFLRHNRDSEFTMHYLDYDELKLMIEEGDRALVLQDRLSPSKSNTHAFGSPQAIAVMQVCPPRPSCRMQLQAHSPTARVATGAGGGKGAKPRD